VKSSTQPVPAYLQPAQAVQPCAPAQQRLLISAIEDIGQLHGYAQHLVVRVTELADRYLGSEPESTSDNSTTGATYGEIHQLTQLINMTRVGLRQIESQLERFNRL
jgi:hypothetical protein